MQVIMKAVGTDSDPDPGDIIGNTARWWCWVHFDRQSRCREEEVEDQDGQDHLVILLLEFRDI